MRELTPTDARAPGRRAFSLLLAFLAAAGAGCDLAYPEVAVVNRTAPHVLLRDPSYNGCRWKGVLAYGESTTPSLRRTSVVEKVSLTTSLQAYALLEMRGYVEARPQSGFYVSPRASRETPSPAVSPTGRTAAPLDASAGVARVLQAAQDRRLVAFGAACPAPSLLPTRALARLVSSFGRAKLADTNAYSFPPGRDELRREIARRALQEP